MTLTYPLKSGKSLKLMLATNEESQAVSRALKRWRKSVAGEASPIKLDAVELAELAFRRWDEARARQRAASSIQEIKEFVQNNPFAEVSVMILAKAPWVRKKQLNTLVGLCTLRRTWANHIFIDFLSAHPRITRDPRSPIRGVGTALMYAIATVGAAIGAKAVWGEATQNSVRFYAKLFGKEDMKDLLYVTEAEYTAFRNRVEEDLRKIEEARKPKAPSARTHGTPAPEDSGAR